MIASALEVSPIDAFGMQARGAPLFDLREAYEMQAGTPRAALAVPTAQLLAAPETHHAIPDAPLLLLCASGKRSLAAAAALSALGYANVHSVAGGFAAWLAARLPIDNASQDADFSERYSRHLRLPQVGIAGQLALQQARVLLVGAGGLGSPAAFYLAAAGVGSLRIVDDDVVERSNLQRQILHSEERLGHAKVESASATLAALNPRTRVEALRKRLEATNVDALLQDVDVVLDGADNFPTRYLLSDACVRLAKPLVYAAVHRFEGQVSVFDAGRQRGVSPCYRCLFPEAPGPDEAPNCSEAGVLGVLPGVMGLLQATEALKLIIGIGESLSGRLLHFDALSMRFRETRLRPDPECVACAQGRGVS